MAHHRQSGGVSGGFSAGSNKSLGHRPLQTKAPVGGLTRPDGERTSRPWASFSAAPSPTRSGPSTRRDNQRIRQRLGRALAVGHWSPRGLLRKGKETLDKWRREGIPPTITNQIQFRADQFVRVHRLSPSQVDDVAGDLMLTLWKAIARFKEGTASVYTYSRGVLDLEYKAMKRRVMRGAPACWSMQEFSEAETPDPRGGDTRLPEHRKLADSLTNQIEALPDDLRDLAERLKVQTPGEIARDLGVHRGTVHRRIERLREHLSLDE